MHTLMDIGETCSIQFGVKRGWASTSILYECVSPTALAGLTVHQPSQSSRTQQSQQLSPCFGPNASYECMRPVCLSAFDSAAAFPGGARAKNVLKRAIGIKFASVLHHTANR